ncbi:hypothetical protein [Amycolatopsis palatopharyngis]|uniref:hypothetical protein n=1 Tax=Amycolatopsis palatopharyngis TaxID=187982 RepID=UPI0013BEA407|nr:hypothetical protein [Amycolatopsis palatopharyngis]
MTPPLRWLMWLIGVLASFAWLELPALRDRAPDKPSGTLSTVFRLWLGVDPLHWRRFLLVPAFLGWCGWLACHMAKGWWRR